MPVPVLIPLINPNEPEALLAALHVREGQAVQRGDLLCTLETTKAASEVTAEADGYIAGLQAAEKQTVQAGDLLCYLAESADWQPPQAGRPAAPAGLPAGLRITRPARALAEKSGLDLSSLPAGQLVTESVVRALLEGAGPAAMLPFPPPDFEPGAGGAPPAIIVYGAGGHGKSLIDLLRALGSYRIAGVVDDSRRPGELVMGLEVLGGAEALAGLRQQGVRLAVNAVGGIGSVSVRVEVFQRLARAGLACPPLVHPAAVVEPSAGLAAGTQVFAHAYVGSEARIGYGSIVNTGAIVSHECLVGEFANLSPGATLAGQVQVGERALVGMRATVNLRVQIGAGARIGNGATVKADVPPGGVVPAGSIWPA
jgi:sugar O-acyltransferase (sialic acid O-acetyltransferase NeuD family)